MTVWPSITAMTAAAADRFAERPAIADGDRCVTFAALDQDARTFAAALVAFGILPGDRVAIWTFNSYEWVVAFLGIARAGAVLVPINTRFKGAEAADILLRSRARVLVTVTDFLGTDYVSLLDASGVGLPDLGTISVARAPVPGRIHAGMGVLRTATG